MSIDKTQNTRILPTGLRGLVLSGMMLHFDAGRKSRWRLNAQWKPTKIYLISQRMSGLTNPSPTNYTPLAVWPKSGRY